MDLWEKYIIQLNKNQRKLQIFQFIYLFFNLIKVYTGWGQNVARNVIKIRLNAWHTG